MTKSTSLLWHYVLWGILDIDWSGLDWIAYYGRPSMFILGESRLPRLFVAFFFPFKSTNRLVKLPTAFKKYVLS